MGNGAQGTEIRKSRRGCGAKNNTPIDIWLAGGVLRGGKLGRDRALLSIRMPICAHKAMRTLLCFTAYSAAGPQFNGMSAF